MGTRRYWNYFTWVTGNSHSNAQDQHTTFTSDGEEDVATTTRTLLRTRVTCELRAIGSGAAPYMPGFIDPGSPTDTNQPFLYLYTYGDGVGGGGSNPSLLTAQNPDWSPHAGRTTRAPVVFSGLEISAMAYIPPFTVGITAFEPRAYTVFHLPPDAGNSEGQRLVPAGLPMTTLVQVWQPTWTDMASSLFIVGLVTIAQLIEARDV